MGKAEDSRTISQLRQCGTVIYKEILLATIQSGALINDGNKMFLLLVCGKNKIKLLNQTFQIVLTYIYYINIINYIKIIELNV